MHAFDLRCLPATSVPAVPWGAPCARVAWRLDLTVVDRSACAAGSAVAAALRGDRNDTNRQGQRVGAHTRGGVECAVLFDGERLVEIGLSHADGASSRALAINDAGMVVGLSRRGLHEHAFVWYGGRSSGLGGLCDVRDARSPIPLQASRARAINSRGLVVGRAATENRVFGFLWSFGHGLLDLGALLQQRHREPAWRIADAHHVDDRGRILATGVCDGCYHEVLLEPRHRRPRPVQPLSTAAKRQRRPSPALQHAPGERPCTP